MELGFLASAARRYWFVIVLLTAAGAAVGIAVTPDDSTAYEAEALVAVTPPVGSESVGSDRYVASQLVLLESPAIAAAVAATDDISLTPDELATSTTFEQVVGTNIVRLVASAPTPELATSIASGYVDAYFAAVNAQLDETADPERQAIVDAISAVEADLEETNQLVADELERYIPPAGSATVGVDIPTIEQINPALASTRETLIDQYEQLLRSRNDFDLGRGTLVASQVVQAPQAGSEPVPSSPLPYGAIVGVFGFLLGATAAAVLALTSSKVLDRSEVERTLGARFAGEMPVCSTLADDPAYVLAKHPAELPDVISDICVRAEASTTAGLPFVVLVTGAERAIGTSTTAAAISARFAASGRRVLLLDADSGEPALSVALTSREPAGDPEPDRGDPAVPTPARRRPPAPMPRLRFSGFDPAVDPSQQLSNIVEITDWARRSSDVAVIDGGPLMASAAALQLSREADAVVLIIPVKRQRRAPLSEIAGQLDPAETNILPIVAPRLRRRHRRRPRRGRRPSMRASVLPIDASATEVKAPADPHAVGSMTDRPAARTASPPPQPS